MKSNNPKIRSPKEAALQLLSGKLRCRIEDVSFLFGETDNQVITNEIKIPDQGVG